MSRTSSFNTTKTGKDGGPKGVSKDTSTLVPTLDATRHYLLNGRKDRVKNLVSITVEFFPGNGTEVSYNFEDEENGEILKLTEAQFQAHQRKKEKEKELAGEAAAARAFVNKMAKRCLLEIADESEENVRRVQAARLPKAAEKMMGKSQSDVVQQKLNTYESIVTYWSKMDPLVKEQMDDYQQALGGPVWSERLAEREQALVEKELERTRKKMAKEGLKAPTKAEKDDPRTWFETTEEEESEQVGGGVAKPAIPQKKFEPKDGPKPSVKFKEDASKTGQVQSSDKKEGT